MFLREFFHSLSMFWSGIESSIQILSLPHKKKMNKLNLKQDTDHPLPQKGNENILEFHFSDVRQGK